MYTPKIKQFVCGMAAVAVVVLGAASSSASGFEALALRCAQRDNVGATSPASYSPLETIRREYPLLGQIVEKFALQDLGEEFPDENLGSPPREIAMLAIHVAGGNAETTRRSAEHARAAGATKSAFEELLYLTAVYVSIPQAIHATRALSDLLAEQTPDRCPDRFSGVALRQF